MYGSVVMYKKKSKSTPQQIAPVITPLTDSDTRPLFVTTSKNPQAVSKNALEEFTEKQDEFMDADDDF